MTGADDLPNDVLARVLAVGEIAAQERREAWDRVWQGLIETDPRLARLRDDPETRGEIEGRADAWMAEVESARWAVEFSRPEVVRIADRIEALVAEVGDLADEARALSSLARGHDLSGAADVVWVALANALDALSPAVEAAEVIRGAPEKKGGPGRYSGTLRPRPVMEFGRAMVALFRLTGIRVGGNASKDGAFATFLDAIHQHVEGRPIPGRAALLAELRKL